jgi:hypothetical protein
MRKLSIQYHILLVVVRTGNLGLCVARCRRIRSINELKMLLRCFSRKVYFGWAPSAGPPFIALHFFPCNIFLKSYTINNIDQWDPGLFANSREAKLFESALSSLASAHAHDHHRSIDQGTALSAISWVPREPNAETQHTSKDWKTGSYVQTLGLSYILC